VSDPAVVICQDADDLARRAAVEFVSVAANAAASGRFTVALSGAQGLGRFIAFSPHPAFKDQIDWPPQLVCALKR